MSHPVTPSPGCWSRSVTYITKLKEADPDVAVPIIYVSIPHDGISLEDAERVLLRPMEKEFAPSKA